MREITYREALREAMSEEMERDERVFLMGEEVGHYNGAYKVSEGLLDRFGERRVVDTPIAETGFAGVGIGAAMVGLRPIIEFMTWNFSLCAYDQLVNNAAKLRYMSGGQLSLPIVFRGPGGAAHQLGAQHSQAVESLYAYVPGLKVVAPATPYDAKGLLKSAIRDENPIVFIEGELLYGRKGQVPEEEYTVPLGKGDVKREGKDVTVVAWSKMVAVALEAATELAKSGIEVEIIDPRTIRPLDEALILRSVKKTSRCVIIEEGWPFAGAGAEISYRITSSAFDYLDAPVIRVTGEDVPMPYAKNLEHFVFPNTEKLINAVKVCSIVRSEPLVTKSLQTMQEEPHCKQRSGRISCTATFLALSVPFFFLTSWGAQKVKAEDSTIKESPALARFSSWVLFGGRAVAGVPFLAYGYLSEIEALPFATPQPAENESSAILTFVIEGTVIDIQQHPPTLFIKSQGTLRFFFNPQTQRDFVKPESFRKGQEVATYELERQVLFEPNSGWLFDSSLARLVSSHNFTFNNAEKNLARLWGSQLTLQSRAHAGNGLPSPLPSFLERSLIQANFL